MYTFENFLKKNRIFSSQSTNRLLSTCLGCWTVLYGKVLNGNGFVCLFVWMRSSWGDEWICIKLSSVLCSALALAVGVDSILFSAVQFNLGRKRRLNVILYFSYSLNWTRRVGWKRKILQRLSRKYGTRVNHARTMDYKEKDYNLIFIPNPNAVRRRCQQQQQHQHRLLYPRNVPHTTRLRFLRQFSISPLSMNGKKWKARRNSFWKLSFNCVQYVHPRWIQWNWSINMRCISSSLTWIFSIIL